jgi:Zn-dependent protease
LGDPTARDAKRLTLNPLRHVDPIGTVVLPGLLALAHLPVFGWAKPVPVNQWRMRNPRVGMMLVAAAGPASNIVMALIAALVLGPIGAMPRGRTRAGW